MKRPLQRTAMFLAGAAILICVSPTELSAQDYDIFGSIEFRSTSAHRKDSDAVIDPDQRDTWYTEGQFRFAATHRLSMDLAEVVVDHELIASPAISGAGEVGSGGTGSSDATEVEIRHEIYQGYLSVLPNRWLSVTAGRRRINWGKAFAFSVTDAVHPQSPDSEVEPGFDGAVATVLLGPDIGVELVAAAQEAIATGEMEDLRAAGYASAYLAPFDLALSFVFQAETIYRPGFLASVSLGPLLINGEAAVEVYDAREEETELQPLASFGVEYSLFGVFDELSIAGEYLYNGLAINHPINTGAVATAVTGDFAGGFERPGEHYLYGALSYQRLESWYTTHSVLYNASDESAIVEHGINLIRIPAIDLGLAVTWNSGKLTSEFGLIPEDFTTSVSAKASF